MPDPAWVLWVLTTPQVVGSTVFWLVVSVVAHSVLVRRFGAPPVMTGLTVFSFAAVAVITLTPAASAWGSTLGPDGCLSITRVQLVEAVTHFGRGLQEKLNILMFVPFGFLLTLTVRRVWTCAAVVLVVPLLIEIVQGSFLGRFCSPLDWTDNAAGGVIGVAGAALALALVRRARRGSASETVGDDGIERPSPVP